MRGVIVIRQKKEQVKPALIMCAVVGVIIMIVFIAATSVNRNVVSNMKGSVLFYGDGLKLYDFDSDELTDIAGEGCFDARFMEQGKIIYADGNDNSFSIYDTDENKSVTTVRTESGQIKELACSADYRTVALVVCDDGHYYINTYSGENFAETGTITESENEICGISFDENSKIYYTVYDGTDGYLEAIGISGGTPEKVLKSEGERMTELCAAGDYVYITEEKPGDSDIVRYGIKSGKTTVLKFNSDDYNCAGIVAVSDGEYITAGDRDEGWGLYVCNGSNMVRVDAAGQYEILKVTDYRKDAEK